MSKYAGKFIELDAAADFLGNGAIETNRYETEITDIVRRESPTIERWRGMNVIVPATGHPHRYFEQTAIAQGSFTDPRNITPTPTGPTRVERPAFIKAITAQTNLSLFDVDVTRMQGQFAYVEAKDIEDITSGIVVTAASAIWSGTDTSLSAPTTIQYVGLLTQITQQATVPLGTSIIDSLKSEVALMVANPTYRVKPTAIYLNPILNDYIDREAKASHIELGTMEIQAGVVVKTLATQAGVLPLISDPYLPSTTDTSYGFNAPAAGNKNYFAVIMTEPMIEMPTVHGGDGNLNPRTFQLGLLAGLQGQYVGVWFNAVLAKGASYAHATVAVVRP